MGNKSCFIEMDNVFMSYPSNIYNARSIKEDLFSLIKRNSAPKLLKDVNALNGFSLHAKDGDRIGVIGHNGAGKSTLLKTIAGIYPIDAGSLATQGKIRSLFDISLGFDIESTGRENILYRGLLLGASPTEMREKTEEIIRFADIGEFIDYPVKTYSTGMAVRLAFSISTCIDGEILLLDEILAAGDAEFQIKARKRIEELIESSRILVFVTHDLQSMKQICNRSILVEHGVVKFDGKPDEAVEVYKDAK